MIAHLHVGIDVSKDTLDLSATLDGARLDALRVPNDPSGFEALHAWLLARSPQEGWRVALEATSAYHRALVLWLAGRGVAALVLNPKQARDLARGLGVLRKNDATDARVLAQCARMAWREPTPLPSKERAELQEVSRRIDALVGERAKERSRLLKPSACEGLLESCRRVVAFLDEEIRLLERRWGELLKACEPLRAKHAAVLSVPGVGPVAARVVVSELYAVDRDRSPRECVAYAGLAPQEQTSGTSVRRQTRALTTGNKRLRSALYMGAVSSARHDPGCRGLYERIVAQGKPKKVALVAVMNKTMRRVAAVAKRGTKWTKDP